MSPFIDYLLKTFLVSGILYGYYHISLRDKRFHQWNRFYLLSAVVLSLTLPLIHIPVHAQTTTDSHLLIALWQAINRGGATIAAPNRAIRQVDLSGYVYTGIVLLQLAVLAWRLGSLGYLYRKSPHQRLEKITLVETLDNGTPFSFFHWIFWNRSVELDSREGQHILRHELTHVHQHHTLDKLLLQLCCIVFFPIVFFYLIRRELQLIHEFLADKEATGDGDLEGYARLLVSQAFSASPRAFTNSFFQHPLKRRIAMITRLSNPRFAYLRKIALLPLAGVLFGLLAFRVEASHPIFAYTINQAENNLVKVFYLGKTETPKPRVVKVMHMAAAPDPVTSPPKVDTIPGQAPLVGIANPELDSVLFVLDGKKYLGGKEILRYLDPSKIEAINVLKDGKATAIYGPEGKHGVIQIIMKGVNDTSRNTGDEDDKVFTKVDVEAQFPGGDAAWTDYVRQKIVERMDDLQKANKSGTCEISFIVDKNGGVTDVKALTMEGTVLATICTDAIRNGPSWVPAQQNGHIVKAFRKQKITFQMPE
jgi:hypothetical protein